MPSFNIEETNPRPVGTPASQYEGSDLARAITSLSGLAAGVIKARTDRVTKEKELAAGQALGQAKRIDLAVERGFISGDSSEDIAAATQGYGSMDDLSVDVNAADVRLGKADLSHIAEAKATAAKLEMARQQGRPDAALAIARNVALDRLIAKNPALTKEFDAILNASNASTNVTKMLGDEVNKDGERRTKAVGDAYEMLRGVGRAAGLDPANETAVMSAFNTYQLEVRRNKDLEREAADLKAGEDIYTARGKAAYQGKLDELKGSYAADVTQQINAIVNDPTLDDVAKEGALRDAERNWTQSVTATLGITDPAEFTKQFGTVANQFKLGVDAIKKPEVLESWKQRADLGDAQNRVRIQEKYGPLLAEVDAISSATRLFGPSAQNAMLQGMLTQVYSKFTESAAAWVAGRKDAGGYVPAPDVGPSAAVAADPVKRGQFNALTGEAVGNIVNGYATANPEQRDGAVAYVRNVLESPWTSKSVDAMDALVPVLAGDNWQQFAADSKVLEGNQEKMQTNLTNYARQLDNITTRELAGVDLSGAQVRMVDGQVVLNVNALPKDKQDGIARTVQRMNLAIKAYSNLTGQSRQEAATALFTVLQQP